MVSFSSTFSYGSCATLHYEHNCKWWNRELTLKCKLKCGRRGVLMVSALDPERTVRARAQAGDILWCSWARHCSLTVPLSTQVYKWVPANCWGKPNKLRGSDLRWTSFTVYSVTVNLIRRSWVRFPPRSKEFFLYLVWFPDSLH